MSEFLTYLQLGFHHVASFGALDHVLFLCALAAAYRPRDWSAGLWVVTAFTVGHSLTLALVVSGTVQLPEAWIEFLIPVTIMLTCLANLAERRVADAGPDRRRALAAVVFGLVHGAGFAGYLRAMFLESIAVPLAGFNLGIETGQVLVLTIICTLLALADRVLGLWARGGIATGYARRIVIVSGLAGVVATGMALTRLPH